jgi:hypothetical protein
MNLVDVTVSEVLIEPHKREDGLWTATVMAVCWGAKAKLVITDKDRWKVGRYQRGFSWQE